MALSGRDTGVEKETTRRRRGRCDAHEYLDENERKPPPTDANFLLTKACNTPRPSEEQITCWTSAEDRCYSSAHRKTEGALVGGSRSHTLRH